MQPTPATARTQLAAYLNGDNTIPDESPIKVTEHDPNEIQVSITSKKFNSE